jgi:hypothetical protein
MPRVRLAFTGIVTVLFLVALLLPRLEAMVAGTHRASDFSIEAQATQLRALVDDSRLGEEAKKQAKQIVDAIAALKQNPGLQ